MESTCFSCKKYPQFLQSILYKSKIEPFFSSYATYCCLNTYDPSCEFYWQHLRLCHSFDYHCKFCNFRSKKDDDFKFHLLSPSHDYIVKLIKGNGTVECCGMTRTWSIEFINHHKSHSQ